MPAAYKKQQQKQRSKQQQQQSAQQNIPQQQNKQQQQQQDPSLQRDQIIEQAQSHREKYQFDQAVALLMPACRANPKDHEMLDLLGEISFENGDTATAQKVRTIVLPYSIVLKTLLIFELLCSCLVLCWKYKTCAKDWLR